MAIVQSSLQEELLSRQERAVIRGVYRASQLSEALVSLSKAYDSISSTGVRDERILHVNEKESVAKLKEYLSQSIVDALVSTKVPSIVKAKKVIPTVVEIVP